MGARSGIRGNRLGDVGHPIDPEPKTVECGQVLLGDSQEAGSRSEEDPPGKSMTQGWRKMTARNRSADDRSTARQSLCGSSRRISLRTLSAMSSNTSSLPETYR